MSSNPVETHVDLIDFHVGSPVLPRRSSITEINFDYDNENLIDTELPVFEKKLQTQSSTISSHSRRDSIDVEDILINIDSDEFERDSLDGEEVETNDFLKICDDVIADNGNAETTETTLPVDNFEALLVLKSLDDLLNATLEESEDITNGNSNNQDTNEESEELDEDTQYILEECLGDLDNYLQALDTYDTESLSDGSVDQSCPSEDVNLQEFQEPRAEFNEELARTKLRQIEENYRKFVASGIVNRGYIDTENNGNFTLDDYPRRPSSACAMVSELFQKKQAFRANTINGARRERPRLARRKSLNENYIAQQSAALTRTSGTDADTTAPEIGRLSSDVSRERHAHASADCCTGTVIVEPLHRQSKASSSSTSAVFNEGTLTEPWDTSRSPWLRSSMRRLQQLTLPNVERSEAAATVQNSGDARRLEGPDEARPVSAPSRLPPITAPNDRSSRPRSRNVVSHQPTGRARSSSASSRSPRRRSISSSGTSVVSSVDSTLSRMQPLEGGVNINNTDNSAVNNNNNNQRRYTFLIAGIIYGAGKLKALRAYEASRTEEKARKKEERAKRLIEEKRLAAERDFQQIAEVFRPPPQINNPQESVDTDNVTDVNQPMETSGTSKLSGEGFSSQCDSSYETLYDTDGSEYTSPPEKSESNIEEDFYSRPLDLSPEDDKPVSNENPENNFEETGDSGYVIQEFDDLPVLPPEDRSCRIPPEK